MFWLKKKKIHTQYTFCILRGHRSKFLNFNVFLSLEIVFVLIANSADPDEILHYTAFHPVFIECQSNYLQVFVK